MASHSSQRWRSTVEVRIYHKFRKGDLDKKTAAEYVALDTTAVGTGGWVGKTVGLSVGLALAPATGGAKAVIIPAVTSIVGSLIGIFTGKGISGWIKGRHLRRALEELQYLATEFRDEFLYLYQTVVDAMDAFFELRLITCRRQAAEEGFFKRMVFPSAKTTFYRMASGELKTEVYSLVAASMPTFERLYRTRRNRVKVV